MINPNTENYTLGKGKLFFNQYDFVAAAYKGERNLGNATEVSTSVELEKLEHYSSTGGLKVKDKSLIAQISPMLNFTLDEHSAANIALLYMATSTAGVQAANDAVTKLLTLVKSDMWYELAPTADDVLRNAGIFRLNYDAQTAEFNVGDELTGGTSSATATIVQVIDNGNVGTLYLKSITGTFADDETITDDNASPGSATANGLCEMVYTNVSVFDTDTPTTFYVLGTDYSIDSRTGRIHIIAGGSAVDMNLTVEFAQPAATYTKLAGLLETQLEGMVRFVSDNVAGVNKELKIWKVSLTPSGDTAYIGDDWSTLTFEGEILKDEVGHPASPYVDVIIDE